MLAVDKLGGQAWSNQVAEATGFTPTRVHQQTRRLSRCGLVMLDQQSLAEVADFVLLGCEVAACFLGLHARTASATKRPRQGDGRGASLRRGRMVQPRAAGERHEGVAASV